MVIYLCLKELSKGGYKTCLISCRKKKKKKQKNGRAVNKQAGSYRE